MKTKHVLWYLGAGAATLAWSTVRAGKGLEVWPGLGEKPPGAAAGAVETVLLWPIAAYHNATYPAPSSGSGKSGST